MTTPYDEPMLSPWEEEGRRQAASLDGCAFVLVVGGDPLAAAELALGIGRVQARRRRVVVADAVGELGPIDDLGPMDAPYGIADVFVRGLPLEQAAHAADAAGNLHVLPSGPMPLDYGALLRSARWEGLSAEFREAEALLLVIVPNEEPAVDALLPQVDGVVLVGRVQPLVGARVLLYVRGPGSGGHDMERVTGTINVLTQPQHDTEPFATRARGSAMRAITPPPPPRRPSWIGWLGALAVIALLAGGLWAIRHAAPRRGAARRRGAGGKSARGRDRRSHRLRDRAGERAGAHCRAHRRAATGPASVRPRLESRDASSPSAPPPRPPTAMTARPASRWRSRSPAIRRARTPAWRTRCSSTSPPSRSRRWPSPTGTGAFM